MVYSLVYGLLSSFFMKKQKTVKSPKATSYPERAKDVPVTQKMLYLVRDELKSDVKSLEHKMNARFSSQDSKFNSIEARFESIEAKMEKISSDIHSIKILVEEQNAKNNIVLDGLTSLFYRQDRIEKLVGER